MGSLLLILIILTVFAVLGVLLIGILSMMRGGEFNKKYGNKLMQARIILQGVALILLASLWFLST